MKISCLTLLALSFHTVISLADNSVQTNNESVGTFVDGSVITAKAKGKIAADKNLKNTEISITTHGDLVILTGNVHTLVQKQIAGTLVKRVEGVNIVDNQLVIIK